MSHAGQITVNREAELTAPTGVALHRFVRPQTTDKSVRALPVKAKLKVGQIIVEQSVCGIVFSFPAAVWPCEPSRQRAWVERLTPWWDMDTPDWSPQAHRLRESCLKSIKSLLNLSAPCTENREPLTDRDLSLSNLQTSAALRPNVQAHRSAPEAGGSEKENNE